MTLKNHGYEITVYSLEREPNAAADIVKAIAVGAEYGLLAPDTEPTNQLGWRRWLALAAIVICSVILAAPAFAAPPTVLRISTPAVPDDWHVKMLYVFKQELGKSLPGRFDVQVHHSGNLQRSVLDHDD